MYSLDWKYGGSRDILFLTWIVHHKFNINKTPNKFFSVVTYLTLDLALTTPNQM